MRKTTVHILSIVTSALLSMAGASLAAISCTKTTAPGTEASPEGAITFSGVDTRAAVEDASEINEFSVWGYYTPEDAFSTVFDKVTVTRENSQWTYDGLQYWKSDKQYDFYALYPTVEILTTGEQQAADNITCNASGVLSIIGFNSTKGHDLMTASRTGMSGDTPQTVGFTFSHELTRLSFMLETNAVTVVSSVLYGVDYKGTFTKNAASSSWSPSEDGTATLDSSPFKVDNPTVSEGTVTLFDDILMIPHSDLTEAVLTISYYQNASSSEIETLSLRLSDADVKAWEKGQSYRYTLQLNMGSISVNVSVRPWVQENTSVEW